MLTLNVLGEMEIVRERKRVALPPSKKTRALLAYLALSGRPQRRDRLCTMFWEVPDDPRGSLRWSLSKLRAVVDEPDRPRIHADRSTVAFDRADVRIDLLDLREQAKGGLDTLPMEQLARMAEAFRGQLLEGLELPDQHEFQGWCVAEREDARRLHARILATVVARTSDRAESALPYARALVQIEPFDEAARAGFVRLLAAAGRQAEADEQLRIGERMLQEAAVAPSGALQRAGRELRAGGAHAARPEPVAAAGKTTAAAAANDEPVQPPGLVGRKQECARLHAILREVETLRQERVVLIKGEPGVGKSRILAAMMETVRQRGGTALGGSAYEAESGRPYGPWIDALRGLHPAAIDQATGGDLAPLLPGLAGAPAMQTTRDRLFAAVVGLIAAQAASAPPVLIALDDVQWCDEASAELLHYVARMSRAQPLLLVLAARDGELPDNAPMLGALRGLRRDRMVEDVAVGPLSAPEIALLIDGGDDAQRIFAESGGNPLLALEIARALPHRRDGVPQTLGQLVRDRIERLPEPAGDVLRWAAVLGSTFRTRWLREAAGQAFDELVAALETLERHALIRAADRAPNQDGGDAYGFAHNLVRRAVYAELSEPRRRLMHWRVAKALSAIDDPDGSIAADIAHHAGLAGEAATAARACVAAGRRCLRLFAGGDAYAMARRGMRFAEQLQEPERVKLTLELLQISHSARRCESVDDAVDLLETLAERALDFGCLEHARLGFHLLSHLHWEGGEWSDAQRQSLRAAVVSRAGDEREQVVAMAEAARCLAMLERNLGEAESLLREAGALSERLGLAPPAIPDALGLLRMHQGSLEEAAALFERARSLAQRKNDHFDEFLALEHLVMLELHRGRFAAAAALCVDLVRIGERLREGSEAPAAHALAAVAAYALGDGAAAARLEEAVAALRIADAKHRLTFVLTIAAGADLQRGDAAQARRRAEEALHNAQLLARPSDMVLAQLALSAALALLGDEAGRATQAEGLVRLAARGVSAQARAALDAAGGMAPSRRKKVSRRA